MARQRQPLPDAQAEAAGPASRTEQVTRESLMDRHLAARQRRDRAQLGSEEFRQAAEDVARIEIAIAALVEGRPQPD